MFIFKLHTAMTIDCDSVRAVIFVQCQTGVVLALDGQRVRAEIWRCYWRWMQYEAVIAPSCAILPSEYTTIMTITVLHRSSFDWLYEMGVVLALDKQRVRLYYCVCDSQLLLLVFDVGRPMRPHYNNITGLHRSLFVEWRMERVPCCPWTNSS